ncbi:MAG: nucleotidyltransferase domain-containing protein [Verrucomicrobiales bacterium]|nr:nucleotidyltransferase domain-containing protein [Verrucomicrobiales bacterium]
MKPAWTAEIWRHLDRAWLADFAGRCPNVVFATISGAHLYGFASPDSDVDLRGSFMLPIRSLVGMHPPDETVTVEDVAEGLEMDFVAHDLRKFARLMLRDNGYVLEQLYSPLVVTTTAIHDRLKELGQGCITRGLYRHYRGFAHGRRKLLGEPGATVKTLLYAYRVYLTGITALREGRIEANICEMNKVFRLGIVDELVERKRTGAEQGKLADGELASHAGELDALEVALDKAHEDCKLPESATVGEELAALVVDARMALSGR